MKWVAKYIRNRIQYKDKIKNKTPYRAIQS